MLPYLEAKAGRFAEVAAAAKADPTRPAQKYGNPQKAGQLAMDLCGQGSRADRRGQHRSRAPRRIDVDVDGDGKADLRVQIGPAIRGTALRDALDFVDFNAFTNQIDFAQFGKAFNTYADTTVLAEAAARQA